MHLRRIVGHLAACAVALLFSAPAAAQKTEDALQFSLSTELVSYSSATVEIEATGVEIDTSVVHFGIRDGVVLEVGYGIGPVLVAGAYVRIGGETVHVEPENGTGSKSKEFSLQIGPKLDVVFGEGLLLRPFAGLAVALESTSVKDEEMGLETSLLAINLQGRAGLHWFVVPAFSIDPMLTVSWGTGNGDVDEIDGDDSLSASATGFSVALMLGISGWIP